MKVILMVRRKKTTGYTILKRKSEHENKKVYVLKNLKTGYYKQVDMGQRAEFNRKLSAKKYMNEIKLNRR